MRPACEKKFKLAWLPLTNAVDRSIVGIDARGSNAVSALCVYNRTRESFLSFTVTAADTHLTRLKGLLGRLRLRADEGIWVVPSQGIHTIGVLFAIDLVYLNADFKVIHLVEHLSPFRIAPIRRDAASVLELRPRTIYLSNTQIGDELVICSPEEMESYCTDRKPAEQTVSPAQQSAKPAVNY